MNACRVRRVIQWIFLLCTLILLGLFWFGVLRVAHRYCPYAVVCFGVFSQKANVTHQFFTIAVLSGLTLAAATMFTGRFFCGWVCPVGTIQEELHRVTHPGRKRFRHWLAYRVHRWLRWLKYLVLAKTLILAWVGLQGLYMRFCPILALSYPYAVTIIGAIFFGLVIFASIFVERFFCRYLCPYGALMNVFQWIGGLVRIPRKKISRDIETSINCFDCVNYCTMQIDIGYKTVISDPDCIHCQQCIRKCSRTDKAMRDCVYMDKTFG